MSEKPPETPTRARARTRRPNARLLVTEAPRAAGELAAMAASLPMLRRAPRGDGHPVFVLPGFTASDASTQPLRWFLRDRGYAAHGWKLGRNMGPTDEVLDGLAARLTDLHNRHGQKLSIVGWSLGGIYARELARQAPDLIRTVVTLGSPVRIVSGLESSAAPLFRALRSRYSDRLGSARSLPEWLGRPIVVPATSIFSRSDGVVPWRASVQDEGPTSENIEVLGSHSGLGHNPAVLWIVADRLAQPEDAWAPFRRDRYPLLAPFLPVRYRLD